MTVDALCGRGKTIFSFVREHRHYGFVDNKVAFMSPIKFCRLETLYIVIIIGGFLEHFSLEILNREIIVKIN
jgi:hypothetical protein